MNSNKPWAYLCSAKVPIDDTGPGSSFISDFTDLSFGQLKVLSK